MQCRGHGNLGQSRAAARGPGNPAALHRLGRLFDSKRFDELVEEAWYSVRQLHVGHFGRESLGDLESAPIDQVSSVSGEKFVQHSCRLPAGGAALCAVAYTCRWVCTPKTCIVCPKLELKIERISLHHGGSPLNLTGLIILAAALRQIQQTSPLSYSLSALCPTRPAAVVR